MNEPVERNAVENVIAKLTERYPSVGREGVEHIVDEEAERLEGNPVREYVPSLIEHAADERLRQEAEPVVAEADPGGPALVGDDELDPMEIERREREREAGFLFGDLGGGSV
ncbi:three-helix bundle dimerization domain-containing protein [Agromyces sp. Marseille-Q5079]|uniref:three-helix bundle dimerization domain-containing protein n=1 Tax=Agromyces sp. Marseille-Q5079 TaxID=3439059 RepID=UPI003D9C916D